MATMEGPLSKWTNVMKGWQYRWFVLDENAGLLSYYTSKEKMMRGARRGCVRLKAWTWSEFLCGNIPVVMGHLLYVTTFSGQKGDHIQQGAVIGIDDEDDSTFTITVDQKTFHFQARDADEKEKWIIGLENTIVRHSQPAHYNWDTKPVSTIADFDRKLAETDAYLQLLIDQVQGVERRMNQCEDDAEREKCNIIKMTAEGMIESIKQIIVLMQISKQNTESPLVNGPSIESLVLDTTEHTVPNGMSINNTGSKGITQCLSRSNETLEPAVTSCPSTCAGTVAMATSVSMPTLASAPFSTDCIPGVGAEAGTPEGAGVSQAITIPTTASASAGAPISHSMVNSVDDHMPTTSYSSSEEEDNFFDAEEYKPRVDGTDGSTDEPRTPPIIASEDDMFDELYDDTGEEALESLDQHGSIITHLLSQVRIGMDLTKIVLPTFILEKRSLLEMYSEFIAHPDLFCSIVDQSTERDRMVQCVRWYMSAFHAGRRSPVAKKPYNPILGETFTCHYDVPNCPATDEMVGDGPIPTATKEQMAFIAEQVSHHPPISAFYAEHCNKKLSIDGYIWTKSKFLGLSIGVHMIGQAIISVVEHGEEYICTFPNGYGRSILTVPWVELGGKTNITCAKTGYYANVEFHTKPFYGGKKDRVTAKIFAPNEKLPFCTVTGEWNGVMWAKYDSGMNEMFVDTKNMPIIKKQVKSRDQQGPFESRRLWQDVTYHLRNKNMEEATEAKHKLEQRQREEAKERKERGVKWETKHFHEVGEHWVYDKPLVRRLEQPSNKFTDSADSPQVQAAS